MSCKHCYCTDDEAYKYGECFCLCHVKVQGRRACASGPRGCDARIIYRVGGRTCGGQRITRRVSHGLSNTYHRVSRGSCCPWQSHTDRKVRRPGAISVAGSRGTPQITGVACGAETRHSEKGRPPAVYPVMRAPLGRSSAQQRSPESDK